METNWNWFWACICILSSRKHSNLAASIENNRIFFTEKIKTHRAKKMLIICYDTTDMSEIRAELKSKHIGSDCVKTSRQNDGTVSVEIFAWIENRKCFLSSTELHLFEYAGKDVYFCVHRMLMLQSIDLSRISYYFVYNCSRALQIDRKSRACAIAFHRAWIRFVECTFRRCGAAACDTQFSFSPI